MRYVFVFILTCAVFMLLFSAEVSGDQRQPASMMLLPGEAVISFKTSDGVNIIGSFFLPADYIKRSKPSLSRIFYEQNRWSDLQKKVLSEVGPAKKSTVSKIIITDGEFKFRKDILPNWEFEKPSEDQRKPEIVRNPPGVYFRHPVVTHNEQKTEKSEQKKEPEEQPVKNENIRGRVLVPPKIPDAADFIDYIFTPYAEVEKPFQLTIKKQAAKKALSKDKADAPTEKKFILAGAQPPNLLKYSCFSVSAAGKSRRRYPAVLLLHMWKRNRHEWRSIIPYLQDAGFVVLSIDMRGHGESTVKNGKSITVNKFVTQNYRNMVRDAFSAYSFLIYQPMVDSQKISVVGASLGTVIAVKLCEKVNTLKPFAPLISVSLFSPSRNFFAVRVGDSIKKCQATSFLFVMDKQDPNPKKNDIFVSGHALYQSFQGIKKAVILDGVGHGTAMLNHQDVVLSLISWIKLNAGCPKSDISIEGQRERAIREWLEAHEDLNSDQ